MEGCPTQLHRFRVPAISVATWCGYTLILFGVFHLVGLSAVSFLYNGRVRNWWKRRKEQRRLEILAANGGATEPTTSYSLPAASSSVEAKKDWDDPLESVDL